MTRCSVCLLCPYYFVLIIKSAAEPHESGRVAGRMQSWQQPLWNLACHGQLIGASAIKTIKASSFHGPEGTPSSLEQTEPTRALIGSKVPDVQGIPKPATRRASTETSRAVIESLRCTETARAGTWPGGLSARWHLTLDKQKLAPATASTLHVHSHLVLLSHLQRL